MNDTVLEIGKPLALGQSLMTGCPFCDAPEKKFAVTRYADGFGYRCFRASCARSGAVRGGAYTPIAAPLPIAPPAFTERPYTGPIVALQGYARELLERIGLPNSVDAVSGAEDKVVYWLRDVSGRRRGWQSRTRAKRIDGGRVAPGPLYGYYSSNPSPELVWLVEDPLSAIRLDTAGESAIALLGTHAQDSVMDELWDTYPECKRVNVALDPGAEEPARKIVTRCRNNYGLDAIQVPLPDDIHRLDSETFYAIIEEYA